MSRRSLKNVGVIGLGIIGRRVAENLRRRGFSVFVWNRTPRPFPNFVGSPAEIAQLADYIQIFVSDDAALLEMAQQLKPQLKAHHIVMAHCTVAPHNMRAAAEIVQRRGAQFLDAPFTGSKLAAEKGELVYYIGGDEAAFKRARPVLEASSKEIIEIGEIGQATTIKIATNMVTAVTVQVAAEALALVQSSGLPLEKFVAALRGNAINSPTLTMKLPKMIARDFDPHFSVKHMLKDVEIASRLGRSYDLRLGATETARDSLLEEVRRHRGDDDFSGLVRTFFPDGPAQTKEANQQPTLDLEEREGEPVKAEMAAPVKPEPVEAAPVKAEAESTDEKLEPVKTEAEPTEAAPASEKTDAPKEPKGGDELALPFEDSSPFEDSERPSATAEPERVEEPVVSVKPADEQVSVEPKPEEEAPKSFAHEWLDEGPFIDAPEPRAERIPPPAAESVPTPPEPSTSSSATNEVQIDEIAFEQKEEAAPTEEKPSAAARLEEQPAPLRERERVFEPLPKVKPIEQLSPVADPDTHSQSEKPESRGFFKRLFNKSLDY